MIGRKVTRNLLRGRHLFSLNRLACFCIILLRFCLVCPILDSELRAEAGSGADDEGVDHLLVVDVLKTRQILLYAPPLLDVISKFRMNFSGKSTSGDSL